MPDVAGYALVREIRGLKAQLKIAQETLQEIARNSTCDLSRFMAEQALDRMGES
jgi:hypothetical protein